MPSFLLIYGDKLGNNDIISRKFTDLISRPNYSEAAKGISSWSLARCKSYKTTGDKSTAFTIDVQASNDKGGGRDKNA
jgi:hypothetical protein